MGARAPTPVSEEGVSISYWVVGGEYKTTRFREIVEGRQEERYGPFPTYKAALEEWQSGAWSSVDDCHTRYRVVRDE